MSSFKQAIDELKQLISGMFYIGAFGVCMFVVAWVCIKVILTVLVWAF
jgi:hypothetical protein